MKTAFFVLEKETNNLLGVYATPGEAEFESILFANNPFGPLGIKLKGIEIKQKDDVPESVWDHLISFYKRQDQVLN